MNRHDSPLDPADWEIFRAEAHRLLDVCIDQLASARDRPWQPVPEEIREGLALGDAVEGVGLAQTAHEMVERILPYGSGNTHPRFFGWVQGTGLAVGLLAEMAAATMNSNCGGRDHGAIYVEREVLNWCRQCFGFPSSSSGVLVSGTSQATVIALAAARHRALGASGRTEGLAAADNLVAYAASGVHNASVKAMELLGLGSNALRRVAAEEDGAIDLAALAAHIVIDRAAGKRPFCVIGTAGTVDRGAFDDLSALATLCEEHGLWLHVDGAFGAWAKLASEPWCDLVRGIERADSIATDFHKWMYVQYDCGLVMIRDEKDHRAAFAARPAYLAAQSEGLGGGEPWFCDYGTDLSRGFRALKVWCALRCHGSRALGEAITRNCELTALMGRLVEAAEDLELRAPIRSNVCCFSIKMASDPSSLNEAIVRALQISGDVVFSTTKVGSTTVIRAAMTNHRTTKDDVDRAIEAVRTTRARLG